MKKSKVKKKTKAKKEKPKATMQFINSGVEIRIDLDSLCIPHINVMKIQIDEYLKWRKATEL